jgi:signal transduction histidine kinase
MTRLSAILARVSAFLRPRSIAARLILAVLAVEALSAVLVVFLSYGYERHAHFNAYAVMLRGRADSVLGAVEDSEDAQDDVMLNQADLRLPPEDLWQATDDTGRVLGRSPNWTGPPSQPKIDRHGYLHLEQNHRPYQVLVLHGWRAVDPGEPQGRVHQVTVYYGAPTDRVWRAVHRAVEFYAAGSLLLLLVTGPLIAWLLQRGLAPLRQLAAQAAHVSASSWQFTAPPAARSTPELAPVTLALESVLDRLEHAFRQQRQFVSDSAHELKTAVAVIKSSLQLLELRPRSVSEYQAGLERCLSDTARLEELTGHMLTLARVESADRLPDTPSTCNVTACLERAVSHLETVAALRSVQLDCTFAIPLDLAVPLHSEDCFILNTNLLLNALQHSPAGSLVQMRATEKDNRLHLSVRDQGEGIDPAVLPHVFERFYRGDPSRNRATGGAGLGLAISRAIVDRAGGAITLDSQPGQGTTVSVELPLAPASTTPASANPAIDSPATASPSLTAGPRA